MAVKEILSNYSKDQIKKAALIKAIFFDVDGVLTDGRQAYTASGLESKQFHVRDSYIPSHLKSAGIIVGIISATESAAASKWAVEHKLDFCHQGIIDKLSTFEKLVSYHKLKKKQTVYIGSELNDLGIFKVSGLSVCPADVPAYIASEVEIVARGKGGQGIVREIA